MNKIFMKAKTTRDAKESEPVESDALRMQHVESTLTESATAWSIHITTPNGGGIVCC